MLTLLLSTESSSVSIFFNSPGTGVNPGDGGVYIPPLFGEGGGDGVYKYPPLLFEEEVIL